MDLEKQSKDIAEKIKAMPEEEFYDALIESGLGGILLSGRSDFVKACMRLEPKNGGSHG